MRIDTDKTLAFIKNVIRHFDGKKRRTKKERELFYEAINLFAEMTGRMPNHANVSC